MRCVILVGFQKTDGYNTGSMNRSLQQATRSALLASIALLAVQGLVAQGLATRGLGLAQQKPVQSPPVLSKPVQPGAPQIKAAQIKAAQIKYAAPIVITRGGVYRGNWQSLDPRTPAVTIRTSQPVTIEDSNIQSRGTLIYSAFQRARVTVRRTRGAALNPGLASSYFAYPGRFLLLEEFSSAVIENNEMTGTSGMYFRQYLGDPAKGETIRIRRNRALNIDGRYSTGPNSVSQDQARIVQFVQFNNVRGLVGAEIAWNEVINQPGKSRPEEVISIYLSSGTAASPILVHNNYLQGAYAARPTTDAYSGGGMNLGDGSARTLAQANAYVSAYHNVVVGASNQGIAVSSGHDIQVFENRVIASGYLPDGRPVPSQNVGIYVWDSNGDKRYGTFYNVSVWGNLIGWSTPLRGQGTSNPWWFPDCPADGWPQEDGSVVRGCSDNRTVPGRVTQTMEAQEYPLWMARVAAAKLRIGLE